MILPSCSVSVLPLDCTLKMLIEITSVMSDLTKYLYIFSASKTEGDASMKNLLGGKGANLAEMCRLGIVVPPGFTITTEACTEYTQKGGEYVLNLIKEEVQGGVASIEAEMGKKFGNNADPLLLRLIRSDGALVRQERMTGPRHALELSDLSEGAYLLIASEGALQRSYRVLIQR